MIVRSKTLCFPMAVTLRLRILVELELELELEERGKGRSDCSFEATENDTRAAG